MRQPYKLFLGLIILIILFPGTVTYGQSGLDEQLAILKVAQQEMTNHSPQFIGNGMGNYHQCDLSGNNIPNMNGKEKMFQSTTVQPNGWVMKEILFQGWLGDSWSNFMKYIFTYNLDNNVTEQLVMNWSSSTWINSTRNTFTYDGNGNMIKILEQEWTGTIWEDVQKDTVIYDITGRASEQITQNWISDAWVNSQKLLMTYDTIYYLAEHLHQNWVSDTWVDTLKDSYTLDENGHELDWVQQNWIGGAWRYVLYYTYTYNQNGNITEQLQQIWENDAWTNTWKQTYTYDVNGYLIQITGEQWSGAAWGNGWIQTNSYDQNGNQSETISRFWIVFEWRYASRITYTWQETTDAKINESGVDGYLLSANYPNPFNPKTKISFSVPKESYITLKVYDLLGREVASLVNDKKQQGEYSIIWSAEGVTSGVYYYRLVAGDFVETKKMILVK